MVRRKQVIVVNDIVATPGSGGVFSILDDFYHQVVDLDKENTWYFLLSGNYFQETENVKILTFTDIKRNWFKRLEFELFSGSKVINLLKPDIYMSLQNTMTFGVNADTKIAYVHQPLAFQSKIRFSFFKENERSLAVHQKLIGRFINFTLRKTKPTIIVQTNWMKNSILKKRISTDQMVKIIRPVQNIDEKVVACELNNEFFYPSVVRTYKNHKVIFNAIEILNKKNLSNFKVKITGSKEDFIAQKIDKKVMLTGMLSRDDVYQEYTKSVLIFPSLMETYGLPLAEAKKVGTIIFAADTEYAHDVLGEYENAYYFDPSNAKELADLMEKFLKHKISLKAVKNEREKMNEVRTSDLFHEILSVGKNA
ncbi:glycosyltransferase [Lactiplantibacillus plantarum]|uniref:glycosyltransferase n=1 Tax=Lactiplantibacillus plantarum TaxID=1590 RepID=UPI0013152B7F|nr:glycosyltransferase [Lactiplantibacillus plantarum]